MKCSEAQELLSLYIDKELDRATSDTLLDHLETCEECSQELENIIACTELLHRIPMEELPEQYHDELMSKLKESATEAKVTPFRKIGKSENWKKYAAIAAAFLLLVIVGDIGGTIIWNQNQMNQSARSTMDGAASNAVAGGGMPEMAPIAYDTGMMESAAEEEAMPETEAQDMYASGLMADSDIPQSRHMIESKTEALSTDEAAQLEDRKKIKTYTIRLEIEDLDFAVDALQQETVYLGGYISNYNSYVYFEDVNTNTSLKEGYLSLKIPKDKYEDLKRTISGMGNVKEEQETTEDITNQYLDTSALLSSKKDEEQRLLALSEKTDSIDDLIKIEEQLSYVRSQIEYYHGVIQNWDKLVAFSTVNISLTEVDKYNLDTISPDLGDQIKNGFITSANLVMHFVQNTLIFIATWSIPLCIAIFVILIAIILFKRKRKNKDTKPSDE